MTYNEAWYKELDIAWNAWAEHARECERCSFWCGDVKELCYRGLVLHAAWHRAALTTP